MSSSNNVPSGSEIRNDGAIPSASQIPNNSDLVSGDYVADALDSLGIVLEGRKRILIESLAIDTINNEKSVAIGGLATQQFAPLFAIVQMVAVGVGAAATGDTDISIGISAGGTQILTATECTGLIGINTKKVIDLSAVVKPALPASSTVYVKVTTADASAGAGHLANVYIVGEIIDGA